jgi:hypothetical protein
VEYHHVLASETFLAFEVGLFVVELTVAEVVAFAEASVVEVAEGSVGEDEAFGWVATFVAFVVSSVVASEPFVAPFVEPFVVVLTNAVDEASAVGDHTGQALAVDMAS